MLSRTKLIIEIANAAITVAVQNDCVERVLDDLLVFEEILDSQPALKTALNDTSITLEKRVQALNQAASKILHPYSINLISVCLQYNRLSDIKDLNRALEDAAREKAKFYRCTAITAVPMSEELQKRLETSMEKRFAGKVRINYQINPAILGGLEIFSGDWHYRGSIQYKLQQLTNHLEMQ